MDQRLLYERACPEKGAAGDVSRLSGLLTEETRVSGEYHSELHEIKEYLLMVEDPKFGRANLEKVTNCVILLRLLQDRDLLGINYLSFIKKILEHMNRKDLLKKVNNYEKQSVKAVDAKPRRSKSDPTFASSDSRCESRHLQQSIDTKKLEIQQEIMYQSNLSTKLEKLNEDIEKQTDSIADSEKELTRIKLEKEQKKKNERTCRDDGEQIEAKIKQLQKESSVKQELERSLRVDIDRMSQEERDVQDLISQSKCKKIDISKRYDYESGKERECSQTIKNLKLELHKLELQINQRSENIQCQHRRRPNSNENGSDLHSGSNSDVTTDALPTERANTINKEYRTQHEPSQTSHNIDPTCNNVIIISAEENADQSSLFQDDLKEIQGEGTLICESIVVRGQSTDDFLNVTNDKIPHAKLLFVLFSKVFVSKYWPQICKMNNFNSAIYYNKPLIISVSAEQNTEKPMGMKSVHNLALHRRDSYYKEALTKLVRQYIK